MLAHSPPHEDLMRMLQSKLCLRRPEKGSKAVFFTGQFDLLSLFFGKVGFGGFNCCEFIKYSEVTTNELCLLSLDRLP